MPLSVWQNAPILLPQRERLRHSTPARWCGHGRNTHSRDKTPPSNIERHKMQRLTGALLPAIAALVLVLGYADVIRGGITVSAILLSLAYCVLVPMSIWYFNTSAVAAPAPGRAAANTAGEPPPYLAATIAAVSVF